MGPDSIWWIKINLIITSEKEKSRRRGRYPKLKQRKVRPCSQGTCWTTSSWWLQSWLLRRNLLELLKRKHILASRWIGRLPNQKLVASTVMALEFRAGPLISAGECEIGIIASETMPKIVVLFCASGAAMRIQSERRLLWWNIWRISLSGSLTPWAIIDEICGASSVGAQNALKECALAEAATFVGIMTGLQDAGELLCCLPKMELGLSTRWN